MEIGKVEVSLSRSRSLLGAGTTGLLQVGRGCVRGLAVFGGDISTHGGSSVRFSCTISLILDLSRTRILTGYGSPGTDTIGPCRCRLPRGGHISRFEPIVINFKPTKVLTKLVLTRTKLHPVVFRHNGGVSSERGSMGSF